MGEPNQYSRDIKRTAAQRDGILHRRFHWCIHAVQYLARKPLSALLTMIAIGIAVTLPIEALRVSQSMSVIARSVDAADLSIYLSPTLSDTELNTHLTTLRTRPDIDIIRIISPAEGVAELAVQPELKSALMNLPDQSLPTTIIVRPRRQLTPEQLRLLSNELSARPGVDQVSAHIDWFTRVQQARDAGSLLLKRLALSLCAAAAVLIGVLLRDSLRAYRDDTILRGAHGDRGSLICLGALLGFGGSAVAWALQATISLALAQPISAFWLAIGINTQMPPMPHSSTLLLFFMLSAVVGATIALLLTFSRPAATGKQGPKIS